MPGRSLPLATAGAFLLGIGLFGTGVVLAPTVSWSVGTAMYSVGALLCGASRLVAWKFELPAP